MVHVKATEKYIKQFLILSQNESYATKQLWSLEKISTYHLKRRIYCNTATAKKATMGIQNGLERISNIGYCALWSTACSMRIIDKIAMLPLVPKENQNLIIE